MAILAISCSRKTVRYALHRYAGFTPALHRLQTGFASRGKGARIPAILCRCKEVLDI